MRMYGRGLSYTALLLHVQKNSFRIRNHDQPTSHQGATLPLRQQH